MKKTEFIELYRTFDKICQGDKEQAKKLAELVRKNVLVNSGLTWKDWNPRPHDIKNGVNIYRSILFFEIYAEYGDDFEAAWRPGIAKINYYNRMPSLNSLPLALPLREGELTWQEPERLPPNVP